MRIDGFKQWYCSPEAVQFSHIFDAITNSSLLFDDPRYRFLKRSNSDCGHRWECFSVAVTDQNGATTGAATGLYVPPTVADHEAALKIDAVFLLRPKNHSWLRLAAFALVLVIMLADNDRIEGQAFTKAVIDPFYIGARRGTARQVRLIGDDDEDESLAFQNFQCGASTINDDKLDEILRRMRSAMAKDGVIEHAVAVEKYGRSIGFITHRGRPSPTLRLWAINKGQNSTSTGSMLAHLH
jgi:hypothetical protein